MFRSHSQSILCLCAALVLLAVPAAASNVNSGIDLWVTVANGTSVNFSGQAIPAGFFCAGSNSFSGSISLKGKNIAANMGLQGADTILERPVTAVLGSVATVPLVLRVLSLQDVTPHSVPECGSSYDVFVRLNQSISQPQGSITISHSMATGGTFNSVLPVETEVIFTNTVSGDVKTITNSTVLTTTTACWNHTPGPGGIVVNGPVTVDSDGDGIIDLTLPGTSNFAPGWCAPAGGTGNPTFSPPTHQAPTHAHKVKAPKKKCSIRPIEIDLTEFGDEQVGGKATSTQIGEIGFVNLIACDAVVLSPR